jgi:hypothetical protein
MEGQLCEGREDLEVVGEASYPDNLWRIIRERRSPDGRVREEVDAVLAAEPDNPSDANAVAVWIQGLKVATCPARTPGDTDPACRPWSSSMASPPPWLASLPGVACDRMARVGSGSSSSHDPAIALGPKWLTTCRSGPRPTGQS